MLVNFCDTCLRTDITCSTVSTEGYEVSNLVRNVDKGFLAYSAIKPPVTIDFNFISNIQISHVIVWPHVGAQKSTGFQLSVKSSDIKNQPFTDVSTGFLKKEELGILFHRRDIQRLTPISIPPNFAERYIKSLNIINYTSTLRLIILKTDNSVPALGKIEIWGRVSPKCSKDIGMNVMALWMNRFNNTSTPQASATATADNDKKEEQEREQVSNNLLDVPEEFLDPITFEIMTQPIILPSGKIIDQKTLEKHGQNEAVWGRPVSDPFTGIRFSNTHKPIAALPLKARIDKFLLEHSNEEEIKKLPRVLGFKMIQNPKNIEVINCLTTDIVKSVNNVNNVSSTKNNVNYLKRSLVNKEINSNGAKRSFRGHALPVVPLRNASVSKMSSTGKIPNTVFSSIKTVNKEEIRRTNAAIEEKFNSAVQVTSMPTCECCTNSIFYKLPCEHIICRKALLSLEKNECTICKLEFLSSDPQRYHLCS